MSYVKMPTPMPPLDKIRKYLPKVVLSCLVIILLMFGLLEYINEQVNIQRKKDSYYTLCSYCSENIYELRELFLQYEKIYKVQPASLSDLARLETKRTWIFTCDLADFSNVDMIITEVGSISNKVIPHAMITYLYFTNSIEGVRIMCPRWHSESIAVDETGGIRKVDRDLWERIEKMVRGRSGCNNEHKNIKQTSDAKKSDMCTCGNSKPNDIEPGLYTQQVFTVKCLLDIYSKVTGRTVILAPDINYTDVINMPALPISEDEKIKMIESSMIDHGIKLDRAGSKFVRVFPVRTVKYWQDMNSQFQKNRMLSTEIKCAE